MALILFLVLILFSSCEKPYPKTDEVIPKKEFIEILTEFYLYKNINPSIVGSAKIDYEEINGYVLQSHIITVEQFKYSYGYYMLDERTSTKILKEIEENLLKMAPDYEDPKSKNDITD